MEWKVATGLIGILAYLFLLSHHGLRTYFDSDDLMNLVQLHGYWHWPWWRNPLEALVIVTPTYRPMGDVFYRLLYWVFGFHSLPFRVACYALMVLNLGLFFRFALMLSRRRKAALLSTLVFSFHAALDNLYFSTGTVYDILCVCFTLAAFITAHYREGEAHSLARDCGVDHVLSKPCEPERAVDGGGLPGQDRDHLRHRLCRRASTASTCACSRIIYLRLTCVWRHWSRSA